MATRPSPAPADEAHPLHYAPSHRTDHSALSAQLIDGKAVAANVHERVRVAVATRTAAGHRAPALATVLVGADPASEIYVRNKRLTCEKVGVRSVPMPFSADIGEAELLATIDALNADDDIDGIIVQLPLPVPHNALPLTQTLSPPNAVHVSA